MKMLKFFLLSVFTVVQTGNSSCDSEYFVNQNRLIMPTNPACLEVTEIVLPHKSLYGPLPTDWHQLKKVKKIDLGGNKLNYNLPKEWKEMESLEYIVLADNHLQGSLPKEWHQLKKVKRIYLYNNKLNGHLPKEWKEMESLEVIQLDDNHLQGPLPKEWHQLKKVKNINLHNNKLNGNLPKEWKEMESLELITLDHNHLQGVLPMEWKEMKNLADLSLNNNEFHGTLPIEWKEMTNIKIINLSGNQLDPTIPLEWGDLEHLISLRTDHVSLYGRRVVLSFFGKDPVWKEIEKIKPVDMDGLKCLKDENGKPYDFVSMDHFDLEDNPTVFASPKSDEEFYCYSEETFKDLWRTRYRNQKFVDPFTNLSFDVNQVKQFKRKLVQKNKQDKKYIL